MRSRHSNKAIERILKIGRMTESEAYAFLKSEIPDAHCLACEFRMVGGADVGLCPKCGSDQWFRTNLSAEIEGLDKI